MNINNIWTKMVNLSPTAKIATSLIAKDAVGCVMYTTYSRRNKRYSPEKRADVANYDLANGLINIGLQILAIKPIENVAKKFSDAQLMKLFFKNLEKRLESPDNEKVMKLLKHKKGLVEGSTALFSIIICQYIIKRFISPYFSMPTSKKFKEWGVIRAKLYEGETFEQPPNLSEKVKDLKKYFA